MDVSVHLHHSYPLPRLAEIFLSKELARLRFDREPLRIVAIDGDANRQRITVEVSNEKFPPAAARFLSGEFSQLTLETTVTSQTDQAFVAVMTLASPTLPVSGSLTHIFTPAQTSNESTANDGTAPQTSGTNQEITGTVKVTIPFVGRMIEDKIAPMVTTLFERDAQWISQCLDGAKGEE